MNFRQAGKEGNQDGARTRADGLGSRVAGAIRRCTERSSSSDGRPRRSFDLRDGPLMEQLTKPERAVIERAAAVIAPK